MRMTRLNQRLCVLGSVGCTVTVWGGVGWWWVVSIQRTRLYSCADRINVWGEEKNKPYNMHNEFVIQRSGFKKKKIQISVDDLLVNLVKDYLWTKFPLLPLIGQSFWLTVTLDLACSVGLPLSRDLSIQVCVLCK